VILRFVGKIHVTRFGSRRHRKLLISLSISMPNLEGLGRSPFFSGVTCENPHLLRNSVVLCLRLNHSLGCSEEKILLSPCTKICAPLHRMGSGTVARTNLAVRSILAF
jgi:hypothetical protein